MRCAIVLLSTLLVLPSLAVAQTQVEATARAKALLSKAPDPTITNGIVTPDAKVTLVAGPDGKEAKIQVGVQNGGLTTTLSFKGKLSEKGDSTLLGLTGLPADAAGAVAVTYSRWNPTDDRARLDMVCAAYTTRRLSKQSVEISGDQSLVVGAPGRWEVSAVGEPGHVTWDFGDKIKDFDRAVVTHAYEKAGIYQVKVTVVREDRFAPSFGDPTAAKTMITTVRSWLVAVSKTPASWTEEYGVNKNGSKLLPTRTPIYFSLRAAPSNTAKLDFGDGSDADVPVGSAVGSTAVGSIAAPGPNHLYTDPGQFVVAAGFELPTAGQFAVVSNTIRVLENCSLSAMASEPDLQREHALAVNWSMPLILAAKYEMGRSSYDFVDAKTGAEQPAAIRTPIAASGTLGTIFDNGTAFALTVERQRTYKAGKSAQLCSDFSTLIVKCDDVVLGGPATKDATIASVMLQRTGKTIGMQPRLAYRWAASGNITSLDVPVYVLQNKDGGLNGGVSFGWRTHDGVRAVLFVGVITDLFGRK